MKKFIVYLLIAAFAITFAACSAEDTSHPESTLTVRNCPEVRGVTVYAKSTAPATQQEFNERGRSIAFSDSAASPFTLTWTDSIQPGNRLVMIIGRAGTNILKFGVANFNANGNATIDYNNMQDSSDLPY